MLRTELIQPIDRLLARHAVERASRVAFVDDVRRVTYGELAVTTARLAGHLVDQGVRSGDRVAMVLSNSVETVETYLAVPRAGGIAVYLNPEAAPAELEYMLADCGAAVVVTDLAHLELVTTLVGDTATVVLTGSETHPGRLPYRDLITNDPSMAAPDPGDLDAIAFMLYTSGTTGRPKGVELTLRSCLWVVAACWAPIAGLCADDVVLGPLPLFHSYALDLCVLAVAATGASERILPRFSSSRVLELLASGECSFLPGVPTHFAYLVQAAPHGDPAAALRMAVSAGAILPAAMNRSFEERFGVQLLDGYGITETSTMVTMNWPHGGRPYGSCGLPLPGLSIRLVDPATGDDAAPGGEGELWVRGPNLMRGYHGKPEQTAEALDGGWYHTGDLARADPNGYLTISGRTKEMIIRGGENIYPAEVENALLGAPGIADAAVVGAPHPDLGEVPVAFVVPEATTALDPEALATWCAERLSWFKVPAAFHSIDAIPRTGSGKVQRYRLVERLPGRVPSPAEPDPATAPEPRPASSQRKVPTWN